MSTASISYSSLRDAAGEARDVAKRLDQYANSIHSSVYKKLDGYEGSWTGNITSARSKANAKISELRTEAGKYRDYANDLEDLKRECESVDTAVKSKVSSLTVSFKVAHGIRNNVVVNFISYHFTSIGNSTSAGRWLNEKTDQIDTGIDYLKQSIEDWYDYNGGKELIKGIVVAVLEVAVAVLGILAVALGTITGVWAVVAAIAAVVGGVIAVVNGITNLVNECRAYGYADDDPATAKRKSDLNTIQDTLRVETDSEFWHNFATGLDIVNTVCAVISIVDSAGKLIKNGIKWVKSIDFKSIFSKDSMRNIKDIGAAFRAGGTKWLETLKGDILHNLKSEFWNFTELNGDFSLANTFKSIKNMLDIPKTLIDGEFSLKSIGEVLLLNITLPALTFTSFEGSDVTGFEVGPGGQMTFDFTERITFDDIYKVGEKGYKLYKSANEFFNGGIDINVDIQDIRIKFEEIQPIDISVPTINFPNINVGYTQAA